MLPERLHLGSHFSLLRYNIQATNLEKRERKSIQELKIYCQLEQANNSFSTQFPFRCSKASLAELWKGNIHMKMQTNNSNSSWKAPTPEHSGSCTAGEQNPGAAAHVKDVEGEQS